MEENIEKTINEYVLNLPEEVEKRINGSWRESLKKILTEENIPEKYHSDIRTEVFSNLVELQRQDEVCKNIQAMLPLDSRSTSSLCESLRNKILVKTGNSRSNIPSESQVGVDIIKEKREKPEPEIAPMQSSATESSAGVDIIQEKEEEEDTRPSPAKDSLLQGIEHPEEARDIESAAKKGEVYNPIKSKLSSSTGKMAPQYKGDDPYREPIE